MSNTIEEAANQAIIDNDFFMADPAHPDFVDRGLEQMKACKWVIDHIFSLPLAQRLTAEEKERINKAYAYAITHIEFDENRAEVRLLHRIFGKDFFKEDKL